MTLRRVEGENDDAEAKDRDGIVDQGSIARKRGGAILRDGFNKLFMKEKN